MEIRQADPTDATAIRRVARASLEASYDFLTPPVVETALNNWYGDENIETALSDPDTVFLVVEDDGEVVGFSESILVHGEQTIGEVSWLHVRPTARDEGIGTRLLERTRETLLDMDADRIKGMVLAGNESGVEFYEAEGFLEADRRSLTIGEDSFEEIVFADPTDTRSPTETDRTITDTSGQTRYLAPEEALRGSEDAFVPVYSDAELTERFGLFCANCQSTAVAVDSMDRTECTECGNRRKPTRWDAVYL